MGQPAAGSVTRECGGFKSPAGFGPGFGHLLCKGVLVLSVLLRGRCPAVWRDDDWPIPSPLKKTHKIVTTYSKLPSMHGSLASTCSNQSIVFHPKSGLTATQSLVQQTEV